MDIGAAWFAVRKMLGFAPQVRQAGDKPPSEMDPKDNTNSFLPTFATLQLDTFRLLRKLVYDSRDRLHAKLNNPLGLRELMFEMHRLMSEEDERRIEEFNKKSGTDSIPHKNKIDLGLIPHFLHLAIVSYEKNDKRKKEFLSMLEYRLLEGRANAESFKPSYFVAYSFTRKIMVVSVRGTNEIADIFTDISVKTVKFYNAKAHKGIVNSAKNILSEIEDKLAGHVDLYKPKQIVFTGHSLGASTAAAMAILVREESEIKALKHVTCTGFCPAAFINSEDLATSYTYLTMLTHNSDFVPRMSLASFDRLQYKLALIIYNRKQQDVYPVDHENLKKVLDEPEQSDKQIESEANPFLPEDDIDDDPLDVPVHEMDFFIPGKIWHLFRDPTPDNKGTPRIAEAEAREYLDIVPSKSMINDHYPDDMFEICDYLIEKQQIRS